MTPLPLLFVLASVDAPAPPAPATVAEPAPEAQAEAEPEPEYEDEYSEAAQIKKRGIPARPATVTDRKGYLKWRRGLSKRVQAKLVRYCREEGGNYRAVCDGIGPYSIPVPPRLTWANGEARRKEWYLALSAQQRSYADHYCDGSGLTEDEFDAHGYSELCGGTPIVLAFGNERVQYSAGTTYDWPTSTTPWLALDGNGDGQIGMDDLFAGFAPLRVLDANADGVLDARDPAFHSLVLWADRDGNRTSSQDELTPVMSTVTSLSLGTSAQTICDARGNCEGDRAAFSWRDATGTEHTGTAIDVYLRMRDN